MELLSEEALQNEAVIYCGPSEGLRRLIEGSGALCTQVSPMIGTFWDVHQAAVQCHHCAL